jgi:hypothetical protein
MFQAVGWERILLPEVPPTSLQRHLCQANKHLQLGRKSSIADPDVCTGFGSDSGSEATKTVTLLTSFVLTSIMIENMEIYCMYVNFKFKKPFL